MDNKLNIRFKQLRLEHGYKSQQALADDLYVDRSLVKSWERNKDPVLPRLDNLLAMCELYKCDLDYLIGRLKERTHDIHFAHEITGLSEKAIKKITRAKPYRSLTAATLSKLIETEGFYGLMVAYKQFLDSTDKLKESSLERPQNNINDIETVVLSRDQATRYFMRTVADEMMFICEEEFKKPYMKAMENERKRIEEESAKSNDTKDE